MVITREEGQEAVVSCFLRWRYLFVEYCTGFGKAKASLDAVNRMWMQERQERSRGLIIVHSEPARDITWPKEINEWAPALLLDSDVKIVCYQSLKNMHGKTYDWVISDECHYLTGTNSVFFDRNTVHSHILMTGILPDSKYKISLIKKLSNHNRLQITLDDAVSNNILNDYRVNIFRVKMEPLEWATYLGLCGNVDAMVKKGVQILIQKAIGARTQFLYGLESKYKATCYLRDQIRAAGRRMVIFMGTKEMCDRISPYRIYEGSNATDYARFLNMEINEIASIKMIQEGANIPRLESSLIGQGNSKVLNFMQKLGRNMRLKPGELARIYIVVADNSYDLSWCQKATREIDQSKITWHDLEKSKYEHYE